MSRARQAREAPSLHQWKTLVKANSAETSNESNFDTLDLKRNKSVKRNYAKDKKKPKKDKKAYM